MLTITGKAIAVIGTTGVKAGSLYGLFLYKL
jgi:hypothetical protein